MRRRRFYDLIILSSVTIATLGFGVFEWSHPGMTGGYTLECSIGGVVVPCEGLIQ
jgi:hypothetical protein